MLVIVKHLQSICLMGGKILHKGKCSGTLKQMHAEHVVEHVLHASKGCIMFTFYE